MHIVSPRLPEREKKIGRRKNMSATGKDIVTDSKEERLEQVGPSHATVHMPSGSVSLIAIRRARAFAGLSGALLEELQGCQVQIVLYQRDTQLHRLKQIYLFGCSFYISQYFYDFTYDGMATLGVPAALRKGAEWAACGRLFPPCCCATVVADSASPSCNE